MSRILVTGGSGFLATHCLLQLLAAGHEVRATLRDPRREGEVRATLRSAGAPPEAQLSFVAAELADDAGWTHAAAGRDFVLHIASPFPLAAPRHEDELLVPAREGSLRVLRAAHAAGVKRVVMTSSFAAIGYGHRPRAAPFDERDWTDLGAPGLSAYVRSKTVAERAAWDYAHGAGRDLELVVINPVGILGPVLGPDYATSIVLVKRMLDGSLPAVPKLHFGVVDARDVAGLHLCAMTHPDAPGERFLASAGEFVSMIEIAQILRRRLGAQAARAPRHRLPDWLVRALALFSPTVAQALPELGKAKNASNEKARRVLGWTPRSNEEAIVATAESLLRLGLARSAH